MDKGSARRPRGDSNAQPADSKSDCQELSVADILSNYTTLFVIQKNASSSSSRFCMTGQAVMAPLSNGGELMCPRDLLTVQEAADACKISIRTMFRWLRDGKLPAVRIGKVTRIRHADLVEFIDAHLNKPKKPAADQS